jgi:trehalose/maltose hydrolase-like predicted phosphorylase
MAHPIHYAPEGLRPAQLKTDTKETHMSHATTKKQVGKEPKAPRGKKNKKEHLQNIISLRISDNQKMMLEKLSKTTSKSISDIMREAVNLWSAKRRKLCMD